MSDSIILERVADVAAGCFYGELPRAEGFEAFERVVATGMRAIGAMALRKRIERFDAELRDNAPRSGRSTNSRRGRR